MFFTLLDQAIKEIHKDLQQQKIKQKILEDQVVINALKIIPEHKIQEAIKKQGQYVEIVKKPNFNEDVKSLKRELSLFFKEPNNSLLKRKIGIFTYVYKKKDVVIVCFKYKDKYLENN